MVSVAFSISFIVLFSSRISVWFSFMTSTSLLNLPCCSCIILLISVNCLSVFFRSLLSFLETAVWNPLSGACEGTLACSTCHLIFEEHIFEKLEAVTDEENDMLDLAYGLTDRSRLGCQIYLTKSMDNMTVRVPDVVADARQSMDVGKNS
uniref:Uncharacterized protein n=1 Tax=Ursus maritimus TaxID=29073 RepID=A0A452TNS7_URSMA